jgi:hypothetical protein
VYLSAHLDKINHFGENPPDQLHITRKEGKLKGLLDDSVGIAVALLLLAEQKSPGLGVLLSEMEEGTGLKKHPELLRNGGKGIDHGQGAKRLSQFLVKKIAAPQLIITIDVTPKFKGSPGTALYSKHWEFHKSEPEQAYQLKTARIASLISNIAPECQHLNNTNDYLTYGEHLQAYGTQSIALEPSIFPYHQADEEVFISDVMEILRISRVLASVQLLSSL